MTTLRHHLAYRTLFSCCWTLVLLLLSKPIVANVQFQPEHPQKGQPVTFIYSTIGTSLEQVNQIEAVVLCWRYHQGQPSDSIFTIDLTIQQNQYSGLLPLNSLNSSGAILFFRSKNQPQQIDNNRGRFYSVLVYNQSDLPIQHAAGGLGIVFVGGHFTQQAGVKPDLTMAISLFDKELTLYPNQYTTYWLRRLWAIGWQAKPGFEGVIRKELAQYHHLYPSPNATVLTEISLLYSEIGDKAHAETYRQKAIAKDPKGTLAQEGRVRAWLQAQKDGQPPEKLYQLFLAFENEFPRSERLAFLAQNMAISWVESHNETRLNAFMESRPDLFQDSMILYKIAWAMVLDSVMLPQAETLLNRSLKLLEEQAFDSKQIQDRYYQFYETMLAWALDRQGRHQEAYTLYQKWLAKDGVQIDIKTLERAMTNAMKVGNWQQAQRQGEQFVRLGRYNTTIKEILKTIYINEHKGVEGFDAYWAPLEEFNRAKRLADLSSQLIRQPAAAFTLTDFEGKHTALSSLKGKTIVLDFWATWCGPCIASFPGMQKIMADFASNPNVVFLFINTLEGREADSIVIQRVKRFVQQRQYTFPVLLDLNTSVARSYQVNGIPTKVVIDADGMIRYTSIGYSGSSESVVEELSMVLELVTKSKSIQNK
ncbi:redoxin domain-containing protein [Larkinella sp. GY13]